MAALTNLPRAVTITVRIALRLGTGFRAVLDDAEALEHWAVEFVPAAVCPFILCASSSFIIVRLPRIILRVPLVLI